MSRSLLLLTAAASLAVGALGCAHCDTCDDFPTPCTGANCGYQQAPNGVPYPVGPAVPVGGPASPAPAPITSSPATATPPPANSGNSAFNANETTPPDSPAAPDMPNP